MFDVEIVAIVAGDAAVRRHAHHVDAMRLERAPLVRIVGVQLDARDTEVGEDVGGDAVVAEVGVEAERRNRT